MNKLSLEIIQTLQKILCEAYHKNKIWDKDNINKYSIDHLNNSFEEERKILDAWNWVNNLVSTLSLIKKVKKNHLTSAKSMVQ